MTPRELYLDLMKKALTHSLWREPYRPVDINAIQSPLKRSVLGVTGLLLATRGKFIVEPISKENEDRKLGRDWPLFAHTMVGRVRLDNLQFCVESVLRDGVPGDLIETGVWRGGASIFMKAVLKAHGVEDRTVWVADSFEGLPPPNPEKYPADKGLNFHAFPYLRVSLEEVRENFAGYGLLDDNVRFLKGWFKDTLATAPVERLAVLRLDGDLYESTMDALRPLYPRLSPGGYVIVDDYVIPACRQAIEEYRREHGIEDEIVKIDGWGAYWRKGGL